jgi:hypothetical protein
LIHRLMTFETERFWQDEPPAIDPKRVPRRARTRVKLAEKILRKFGVWPRRQIAMRRFVEFSGESLLQGIVKNFNAVNAIYRNEIERILVGTDQINRLCGELDEHLVSRPYAFDERVRLMGPDGMRICGVRVQVVPWMRGVLLVPKDER